MNLVEEVSRVVVSGRYEVHRVWGICKPGPLHPAGETPYVQLGPIVRPSPARPQGEPECGVTPRGQCVVPDRDVAVRW